MVIGVLGLFGSQGAGCSGCGSCFTIGEISCEFNWPDAPTDASWVGGPWDGGRDAPLDTPFSSFDVPREACDYFTPGSNVGAYCAPECGGDLGCTETLVPVDGVLRPVTPSFCTRACVEEADCGPCAACTDTLPLGASRVVLAEGVCAPRCRPSALDRGTCLPGFTCDLRTETCLRACASDEECALVGDGYVFTTASTDARCDLASGRCIHDAPAVPLASPCASDLDCGAGDVCYRAPELGGAGFCTRFGCLLPWFECVDGGRCEPLAGTWACLRPCHDEQPCPGRLVCAPASGTCRPPSGLDGGDAGPDAEAADSGNPDTGEALDAPLDGGGP